MKQTVSKENFNYLKSDLENCKLIFEKILNTEIVIDEFTDTVVGLGVADKGIVIEIKSNLVGLARQHFANSNHTLYISNPSVRVKGNVSYSHNYSDIERLKRIENNPNVVSLFQSLEDVDDYLDRLITQTRRDIAINKII